MSMEQILENKNKGNEFYKQKQYEEARDTYTEAIVDAEQENSGCDNVTKSILYGNRAACFVALELPELCISDCNKSLEYQPNYTKVRLRKFWALRKVQKYNEALEEIKKAIEEDPSVETTHAKEYEECKKEAAEETEKLKTEAIGQLKDLGNKFLGLFGLSTDNFKLQQNENGGYNVQFQK
ncbi:TPR Domain containing protein [Trichomonas vaginalis G3]|uniref:TPR Domain containing protein n=1 Tax=Trichomonas vaginalis (strain ATCC PRA-98 / G3) TaxID=412133 RepID=A2EY20_TRIV3|nr:protein binding, bridging [Trichomonas vaginalis G3]EAY02430.1 TPR Domain containing protein [Trichomonas vaginalis G3]KAI5527876.1 protein binding, bridging [Trichomonas vaginalis G3]|eukprot:XP_001314688.1 TPR Domain containing protein [Trichomonas vaginalis G3]